MKWFVSGTLSWSSMIEKQCPELVSCKSLAVVLPPERSNCCHLSIAKTPELHVLKTAVWSSLDNWMLTNTPHTSWKSEFLTKLTKCHSSFQLQNLETTRALNPKVLSFILSLLTSLGYMDTVSNTSGQAGECFLRTLLFRPSGMNGAVRAVVRMGIYVGAKVYFIHEVRRDSWLGLQTGPPGSLQLLSHRQWDRLVLTTWAGVVSERASRSQRPGFTLQVVTEPCRI